MVIIQQDMSDDIAILINGKLPQTMSEVSQTAPCTVQDWYKRMKLSIDPDKMAVIHFTRKRTIKGLKEPIVCNKMIQLSSEVKYLGITFDKGLTWKKQLDKVINKVYKALWTCRGTFWKTWGLKQKVIYWIHTPVVRPIITYAATIWWPSIKLKTFRQNLASCKGWPAWDSQEQ
jgi:hypothetical protein